MRRFVRLELIAATMLLAVCALSRPASADTETVVNCANCNGYTFQASLTPTGGGNYSVSYTITNTNSSTSQNAYAFGWSLTMFQNGGTVTNSSLVSVTESGFGALSTNFASYYTLQDGKSNNGSNGNCNDSVGGAICVSPNGALNNYFPIIAPNQSLTFNLNLSCPNCTPLSSFDFLSSGKCVSNPNANCYSPSAYGSSVGVPEPSVLALLASEMALMAGVVLVFGPVRNRFLQEWVTLFRLQPRLTS
jgi:hypothetical protein